jgi:hypothetical protein
VLLGADAAQHAAARARLEARFDRVFRATAAGYERPPVRPNPFLVITWRPRDQATHPS